MSTKDVGKFYEQLALDEKLRDKVTGIADKMQKFDMEKERQKKAFSLLKPIAKKAGYDFTFEDVEAYQLQLENKKEQPGKLLAAAGNGCCVCVVVGAGTLTNGPASATCTCYIAGGGSLDYGGKRIVCGCAYGGGGG
jgi:hypothetical protein